VFIGNGYVSPLHTAYGYWETLCTTNPGVDTPIFNETRCDIIATNLPRCIDLSSLCYQHPDPEVCLVAGKVCWEGVTSYYDGESGAGGRNRFDITHPCYTGDRLCYREIPLIQKFLNLPWVWESLQVPKAVENYSIISDEVNYAFQMANDIPITLQPQVLYLLNNDVDVLFYQGNLDLGCNTAGTLQWASSMSWKGQPAFVAQSKRKWGEDEQVIGWFKEVKVKLGESDRKVTFAISTVNGAGHMVPYDKPKEALALITKWLDKRSFA
jgi:cathepsin A (carboxypeptidase C)